jgi:hypothetical protein
MLMKILARIGAMGVAALLVAAVGVPAFAADEVTVGQFVQRLAVTKNLNATDARIASDSLRAVGVRLPADLDMNARLTESDVVAISRSAGLRVTSSNPEQAFTPEQVDAFFFALADEISVTGDPDDEIRTNTVRPYGEGNGNGWGPPFDPFTKGKGQAKGKAKGWRSPYEPE